MKKYIVIGKNVGETPLSAMEKARETETALAGVPLTYAGRLDPMASGKLLVLIGDECKNQTAYHSLDKEYEFEILFGFESDTGDVLGITTMDSPLKTFPQKEILSAAKSIIGVHTLPYPHFSSKTVQGKPLFLWTLENRLDEIKIPTIEAQVFKINLLTVRTEPISKVIEHILQKINLIPQITDQNKQLGRDFRRDEIRVQWNKLKVSVKDQPVTVAKFRIVVSSGTYIRSLAPLIAQKLGTTGLAYSIHRTKIGTFWNFGNGWGFWKRLYS